MLERFIDYIQFSSRAISAMSCIENSYSVVPAVRNYAIGYRSPLGIRVYFSTNPKNSPLVIASGETLYNLRNFGNTDSQLLAWAFEIGAKFSRIDLAVTESKEENTAEIFTMLDVKRWVADGLISSPLLLGGTRGIVSYAPKSAVSDAKETVETIYVGNMQERGKKGIFRAYDKGIELGITAENVISRIELEIKRERANVTAKILAKEYNIAGNFRARFDVNDAVFERIMNSPAIEIKRGEGVKNREETEELDKRWQWLLTQVAPSLKKAIEEDKKLGRVDRFNAFLHVSGLSKKLGKLAENMAKKELQAQENQKVDISKELWHN